MGQWARRRETRGRSLGGSRKAPHLLAVGAEAHEAWRDLCARNPELAVSQTPAWSDCVRAGGQFVDATRLYETPSGRHVILPLARWRRLPGALAVEESWPRGWGYGGFVTGGSPTRTEDIATVVEDLHARPVARTAMWTEACPDPAPPWAPALPADVWHRPRTVQVLDLEGGFANVWTNRFRSKVRSASRKAERRGVVITFDDGGRLVPAFDDLYRMSVERWARERNEPVMIRRWLARRREPRARLESVAARLGPACRIGTAYAHGQLVAAIVVLTHGVVGTYWGGAMDKNLATGSGANELLHRLVIEDLCDRGFRWYDMGASPSPGVARFKYDLGAVDWRQHHYRFERLPLSEVTTRGRAFAKTVAVSATEGARRVRLVGSGSRSA